MPADVLARVELLRDELELIRFEMGRPRSRDIDMPVGKAAPREVVFQAFTLYRRVMELRDDLTGTSVPQFHIKLPKEVQPFDVWKIVDAAYAQVLVVNRALQIPERAEEVSRDLSTTPADVFRAISRANRQADLLVVRRLSSNDVFYQVKLATHYATRLLAQFSETTLLPETPARERGKRSADVNAVLIECYMRVRAMAQNSGIETLELEPQLFLAVIEGAGDTRPSDVHDMATLLVPELAYIHEQLGERETPRSEYDLELKLPSHVYQNAEVLLAQLRELESSTRADSAWLTRNLVRR